MYYGNTSVGTTSSGSATFDIFDDYESDSWTYSENGASFSGSLATDAWVSASHGYKLVYPSSTSSSAGYYGRYTKPLDVGSGSRKMRMSVKDSYTGGTSGYHKKQVYIGATKYYDADVSGGTTDWTDTGWVNISSTTGNQNVYFQIYENSGVGNFGINVWYDNLIIRKSASSEPTGSIVSEQSC